MGEEQALWAPSIEIHMPPYGNHFVTPFDCAAPLQMQQPAYVHSSPTPMYRPAFLGTSATSSTLTQLDTYTL